MTISFSDKSLDICISYEASRGNDKSVWHGDRADGIGDDQLHRRPVFKVHGHSTILASRFANEHRVARFHRRL